MFKITQYKNQIESTTLSAHVALAALVCGGCYITFEGKIRDLDYMRKYAIADVQSKIAHGSGIDADWRYEFDGTKLCAYNSYHAMDANGMYAGWIDFTAIIEYGMKNSKFGIRSTDVMVNEDMIESILSDYELDEDEASNYEDMEYESNEPYLDDLPEFLWSQIFDGNMMMLPIV